LPSGNSNLLNPDLNSMESIGKTKEGVDIFKPKTNSKWNKEQYDHKFSAFLKDQKGKEEYEGSFKTKIPTFEEYAQKNPVLIVKDAFGRYLLLGEYVYRTGGGCGKPVVYLYPNKTTDINLKFNSKMQLDVDIPKYSETKGWNVRAESNGQLQDLQATLTDCNQFQKPKFGQEYALDSCQKNQYPYIYWAGNTPSNYPQISSGFVVSKTNLEAKLKEKLMIC
jgi:hypothetical protein